MIIIPDGRLHAGTGKRGSLESYASATGVTLTAIEFLENSKEDSLLRNIDKSIHLVDLVAQENTRIYSYLKKSGRLGSFLQRLRVSMVELLGKQSPVSTKVPGMPLLYH